MKERERISGSVNTVLTVIRLCSSFAGNFTEPQPSVGFTEQNHKKKENIHVSKIISLMTGVRGHVDHRKETRTHAFLQTHKTSSVNQCSKTSYWLLSRSNSGCYCGSCSTVTMCWCKFSTNLCESPKDLVIGRYQSNVSLAGDSSRSLAGVC